MAIPHVPKDWYDFVCFFAGEDGSMAGVLDVIVIGAGSAGLGVSYFLKQQQLDHQVLERGRIGETWRTQRSFRPDEASFGFAVTTQRTLEPGLRQRRLRGRSPLPSAGCLRPIAERHWLRVAATAQPLADLGPGADAPDYRYV